MNLIKNFKKQELEVKHRPCIRDSIKQITAIEKNLQTERKVIPLSRWSIHDDVDPEDLHRI